MNRFCLPVAIRHYDNIIIHPTFSHIALLSLEKKKKHLHLRGWNSVPVKLFLNSNNHSEQPAATELQITKIIIGQPHAAEDKKRRPNVYFTKLKKKKKILHKKKTCRRRTSPPYSRNGLSYFWRDGYCSW